MTTGTAEIPAQAIAVQGEEMLQPDEVAAMVVDDEAIGSAAYQTIRRSLHVATEEETRRRERWDARHRNDWDNWDKRPSIPYYDFTPTTAGSMTYSWGWASPRDRNSSIDFHSF